MSSKSNLVSEGKVSRRAALAGMAAAFAGVPVAASAKASEPELGACRPTLVDEPTGDVCEPRALIPCHPRNDARVERLTVLLHAFREDCWRLAEEHGEDCGCGHCDTLNGSAWVLEMMDSCIESELAGWSYFFDVDARGAAKDIHDAAHRLNLPVEMIREYAAYRSPGSLEEDDLEEARNRCKAATA